MRTAEDMVRVRWGTMNDGLAGLMWRDGLSDPVVRYRAENLCLLLGADAQIVEPDESPAAAPPSQPTPEAPASPPVEVDAATDAGASPPVDDPPAGDEAADAPDDAATTTKRRRAPR